MRLYQQLVIFMLAATVLPLAGVGFWLLGASQRALVERLAREQRAEAVAEADRASGQLLEAINALSRAAEAIDWPRATEEEKKGALSLLYQQSPKVAAVVLVDAKGQVLLGPIWADPPGDHPSFQEAGLAPMLAALPLDALGGGGRGQAALSPAYLSGRKDAALALGIKLGDGREAPFAIAELSLASIRGDLAKRALEGETLALIDGGGRILASSAAGTPLSTIEPAVWDALQKNLAHADAGAFAVAGKLPSRVAAARLAGALGLYAIARTDEAHALAPVARMRRTALVSLGLSLFVLLAAGAIFTRRLNRRLGRVMEGAEAFGRGELSRRISLEGGDELSELADTFNRMGGELEGARARLLRWNDELKQKVDEATADLRAAQAQLVEAQKLAAVGQLGAGVAHEINNPLAGILGHTQLLLLDREPGDSDFDALRKIEQSAKRCKEITQNLLRFSQQKQKAELRPIDLNSVVREAMSMAENQIKADGIELKLELSPSPVKVHGDPGHLTQLLLALVSNARTAMAKTEKKELTVRTELVDDGRLRVADTGKGIAPENLPRIFEPFFTTKDIWSNVGLGLSVSYRIATEHQGKIEVSTEVGKGSAFTLRLPLKLAAASGPEKPAVQADAGAQPAPATLARGEGGGRLM